jgi:hypothetical protein
VKGIRFWTDIMSERITASVYGKSLRYRANLTGA